MLLIYWNDHEVSKYKDMAEFMFGRDNYNNVHMATELQIRNGEIRATHWNVDDLINYTADNEQYHRS